MIKLAQVALLVFVAAVVLEHALQRELDPAQHQISEYATHSPAWLMTLALGAWACSLAMSAWLMIDVRRNVEAACLAAASTGLALSAIFETQTSAGELPAGVEYTASGRLHDLGSGVASLALLGAALVAARQSSTGRGLRRLSLLTVIAALTLSVGLLAIGPSVGGVRQRILVGLAVTWHGALLRSFRRNASELGQARPGHGMGSNRLSP